MSQENVEIVRSFYDAWARDEFPGPIDLMDREIEYVNPAGAVEPGTQRGVAAFSRAVEMVFDVWETWEMDVEKFTEVGDQVAVMLGYRARGRGSGIEVKGRESALWTLRNGKVVRYAWFHEPADALEAALLTSADRARGRSCSQSPDCGQTLHHLRGPVNRQK
jgi:Ketosteroid isomerase-related protein